MKGTVVSDFIRPIGWMDKYPTHLDIFGKGGLHSVATLSDRDDISLQRRNEGMLSFSQENKAMYSLLGGITNDNWLKIFDLKDNKVNFNISCDENYILVGNKDKTVEPSPQLIDIKLDLIKLKHKIDNTPLDYQHIWIGDSRRAPIAQKNIGIENLPILGAARLPLPDTSFLENIPFVGAALANTVLNKLKEYAYLPNPTQPINVSDPLSNLTYSNVLSWVMGGAWLPETFVGSSGKVNLTFKETVVSSALALTAVSLARAHKLFDNSSFIVRSRGVRFTWENYLAEQFANTLGGVPAKLYGYQNTYDYGDKAQALDELDRGLIWNNGRKISADTDDYGSGVLRQAIAGDDYIGFREQNDDSRLALFYPKTPDQDPPAGSPEGTPSTPLKDIDKFISRSNIIVTHGTVQKQDENGAWGGGDNVKGINQLRSVLVQAYNTVTSDDNMIAANAMQTRKLVLFDYNDDVAEGRRRRYASFKGPAALVKDIELKMPFEFPHTDIYPPGIRPHTQHPALSTELVKNNGYILSVDELKYELTSAGTSYIEGQLKFIPPGASSDAKYIVQTKNSSLANAQSLGELETGILKNTVTPGTLPGSFPVGVLSQAISGEDYVNTSNIPVGPLVIIDPLYPTIPGHKLIAPTKFNIRKGIENEFGKLRDPQSQQIPEFNILEGEYAKFKNIGLPASEFGGGLLKVNDKGELMKAIPDVDFPLVETVSGIALALSSFKSIYETFQAAQTIFNTTQQTKDAVQDANIIAAEAKATISTAEASAAALEATTAAIEATAAAATATGAATAAGVSAAAAAGSAIAAASAAALGGSKGDTGNPGPKGDKGDKGDTGSQGPSGLSILEGDVLKEADSLITRIKDNPIFQGQYVGIPITSSTPDINNVLFFHEMQI